MSSGITDVGEVSSARVDPRHCGNCGASDLAVRVAEKGTVAKVACRDCGASGPFRKERTREGAISAAIHAWNHKPPVLPTRADLAPEPPEVRVPRRSRRPVAPHSDERDVLELVARMVVPSGWRIPVEGRGSSPGLQSSDVAAALGMKMGRLERETALAVATRAGEAEIAQLTNRAYRRALVQVGRMRPTRLNLEDGADRWRLRLVLYDAAYELVWPEWGTRASDAARRIKMRKADYLDIKRVCTSVLQEALSDARRQFGRSLFAE